MYKIFCNKRSVFLNDEPLLLNEKKSHAQFKLVNPNKEEIKEIIEYLECGSACRQVSIINRNLDQLKEDFFSFFKIIEAAGGLVRNKQQQILLIFRNGKWDLPKGKMEKQETREIAALREVEEETGVKNLSIVSPIILPQFNQQSAWHTYNLKGRRILKFTYWFAMTTKHKKQLKPQIEEGITEVGWFSIKEADKLLKDSYGSIRDVYKAWRVDHQ